MAIHYLRCDGGKVILAQIPMVDLARPRSQKRHADIRHVELSQPCSTLGASPHSSIPHREIPLRFRERGRASWGVQASFLET